MALKFDRSLYYKYKGIKFHSMLVPSANLDAMETFEVRPDDIFLITYPKCGTHWSVEIINLILTGGHPEKIDRSRQEAALEMSSLKDKTDPSSTEPSHQKAALWDDPRLLITHLPEVILPPQAFTKKVKVIYVARNPKDCLVSLYHAMQPIALTSSPSGSLKWEDHVQQWILNEDLLLGSFFDHVLAYWKHRHDPNVLFMKYEDMKKDPKGSIVQFANHLERPLSDEELDRVVHHSEVKNMKKTYDNVEKNVTDGIFLTKAAGLSPFIRKGQIGDWKNSFTVAQNELFDALIKEKLTGTGLTFDFE